MGKHHGPYAEPGRSAVVVEEKILDMLGSDAEALIADVRRDPEKNRTHPAKLRRELAEAILSDKAARPTDAGGSTAGPSSGIQPLLCTVFLPSACFSTAQSFRSAGLYQVIPSRLGPAVITGLLALRFQGPVQGPHRPPHFVTMPSVYFCLDSAVYRTSFI